MNPSALPDAVPGGLGGIRLTFHPHEIEKAFCYGEMIKHKGYKLFMQPVGTAGYSDEELIHLIKRINRLEPYAFYLVDTLGTMYGRLLLRQVILADNNLSPSIKLGYHSHNNLQMAFANAQKLLEYKTDRGLILDCSASGMAEEPEICVQNWCSIIIIQSLKAVIMCCQCWKSWTNILHRFLSPAAGDIPVLIFCRLRKIATQIMLPI